ncbi:LTA synthase family protein [Paenibacillus sp. sptzw28]|uniref:LTA synthase family protein n=1 Tax=Paenibacillus sp. sptzw28 TaxID=715179 RepID=UPI001C6E0070|nr:LTA synthase family protein [Paenibacillus sp. sptzw28]QYR20444.1 LTA synthase family protein [Paenibacillus sp. sptzw28]
MKPFIFFTLILLLKSALAYFVIFDGGLSWTILITEIPFIWLMFCLIEMFATKRKLGFYMAANFIVTAVMFAVIMYYKYYGVIVTYHALGQVTQVTAVKSSVFSLLDPYYLLIFLDIIVLGFIVFRKKTAQAWKTISSKKANRKAVTALFTVSLGLCFFSIYPNRASMNEIVKAEDMGILNYEFYTLLAGNNQELTDINVITQEAINKEKNIEEPASPHYWNAAAGKNVIILQLEAFQTFLVGLTIDGKEITPNLNKLARENFYFPNFFQQVGQGNTSDAEFVVNTSFLIPPKGAASQVYANKAIPSLPKLLSKQGYRTATFHTNSVEFWNRKELYEALGFDRYYDQEFFGQDDTVFFGPSDEELYGKTAEELEKMGHDGVPFYAQVISMTAHHPFTIPERKYKMTLPDRYEGTFVGDYIRAQNYADYTMGLFIDDLKKRGIWDNSILVVYGDHLGLPIYSLNRDDKELMQEIYGREYGYADMLNIPLVITSPDVTKPAVMTQIGGQSDIMPTIANLTGVSLKDHIYFGQDLLNQSSNLLPERYYLPSGSFIADHSLFVSGAGYEDGSHHPLQGLGNSDSKASLDEYNRALKLLHLSDSYVSQLPDRD